MYCTVQDIEVDIGLQTLIMLTDDNKTGAVIDEIVDKYISEEESYINSYISNNYTLPITDLSGLNILKQIEVTLVVCDLYRRGIGLNYPETLEMRRASAIADLNKIQKGLITLQAHNESEHKYVVSKRIRKIDADNLY